MAQPQVPSWIAKHSSNVYLLSVLRTLSARDDQREVARQASASKHPNAKTGSPVHYSVAIGAHPTNQHRNRYADIHPYDRTHVAVNANFNNSAQTDDRGKYLNASWVLERYGGKWWIASQATLPHTAHTFLSLFFQPTISPPSTPSPRNSRIRTVVQLTKNIESGRRKADPYFPDEVGHSITVSPERGDSSPSLKVTLINQQIIDDSCCVRSTISVVPINSKLKGNVVGTQEPVIFQHMLYTSWPDHGVPKKSEHASLLAFMRLVEATNRDQSLITRADGIDIDPDPPIIVGCSAGIGRTGSFITLSSLLRHFGFLPKPVSPYSATVLTPSPLGAIPDSFGGDLVVQEIDSLREQRPRMVERNEQVILIYEVLASAFVM